MCPIIILAKRALESTLWAINNTALFGDTINAPKSIIIAPH